MTRSRVEAEEVELARRAVDAQRRLPEELVRTRLGQSRDDLGDDLGLARPHPDRDALALHQLIRFEDRDSGITVGPHVGRPLEELGAQERQTARIVDGSHLGPDAADGMEDRDEELHVHGLVVRMDVREAGREDRVRTRLPDGPAQPVLDAGEAVDLRFARIGLAPTDVVPELGVRELEPVDVLGLDAQGPVRLDRLLTADLDDLVPFGVVIVAHAAVRDDDHVDLTPRLGGEEHGQAGTDGRIVIVRTHEKEPGLLLGETEGLEDVDLLLRITLLTAENAHDCTHMLPVERGNKPSASYSKRT